MTMARRASVAVVLAMGWLGAATPARAQPGALSVIINIAAEPSIGGTAIGGASGTINGTPFSVADASWSKTHSQHSPLFVGGVAITAARNVDVVAFVDYGHAGANSSQIGQLGGVPVTLMLDDYKYWGLEGGAHLRRESGLGPYATLTAGFRRISQIQALVTTVTLTRSVPVYDASVVPTFAFGGGWLFGNKGLALGVEVAVRYAGAPSQGAGTVGLPTTVTNGAVTPASGAGARWSLPVGVILKF
jgi:hypothetical protein